MNIINNKIKKNSKIKKSKKKNSKKKNSKKKNKKISRITLDKINIIDNYDKNYDDIKKDINIILSNIDYPYLKFFINLDKIKKNFLNLIKFKPKIIFEQYTLINLNLPVDELKFDGKYFLIIDEPFEYESIELISDYFNEECRVRCKFLGQSGTTYDYFRNNFIDIINFIEKNNKKITIENMREAIWNIGFKECSTFKPKLEKFFIEFFGAKKVLDISSGWGDRLIGAMASNIDCYHGFDPNPCLHKNYNKIIETFKEFQVNKKASYIIKKIPFEEAKLKNNFYDLVMTSPPYFNMEIYDSNPETSKKQSISTSNSSIEQEKYWYNNYLLVWMHKCHKALKNDGIIAININQHKNQNYVYWLLRDMKKKFTFLGTISHSKINKKNPQPTFIWKK